MTKIDLINCTNCGTIYQAQIIENRIVPIGIAECADCGKEDWEIMT